MTSLILPEPTQPGFLSELRDRLGLDATKLKILAVVLMVIDHIHQMWAHNGAPLWLTMLGRPVFPIFLFLLADSFHYTRSRKKLLWRLLIAGWVMTIGTALIELMFPNEYVVLMNNAFTTFFITGLYICFYDRLRDAIRTHSTRRIITSASLFLLPVFSAVPVFMAGTLAIDPYASPQLVRAATFIALLVPNILIVEGGPMLVLLGLAFYILRRHRAAQIGVLVAFSALVFAMGGFAEIQWLMVFAAIPIWLYNGKPGRGMKDFFYVFYPAHIWILYIISTLLTRFGHQL